MSAFKFFSLSLRVYAAVLGEEVERFEVVGRHRRGSQDYGAS